MDIVRSFRNALKRMDEKHWDTIYVLVDLHGTIFKPCYKEKEEYEFYPYAKDALQMLSDMHCVSLILWTSTDQKYIPDYIKVLNDNRIYVNYINGNPDVRTEELTDADPEQLSFKEKFYYNVGIDDKFGFDPETDWGTLYEFLLHLQDYWIHIASEKEYEIVSRCSKMKMSDGTWVDAIVYRPMYDSSIGLFTRERNSFFQAFVRKY